MKTTNESRELTTAELDGVSGGLTVAEMIFGAGVVAGYAATSYALKPTVGEIAKKVINNPSHG